MNLYKLLKTKENSHENCINIIIKIDENSFATGSSDKTIKIWSYPKLDLKKTMKGHIDEIWGLEIVD
jgi:WD40 repeat protein